MLIKCSLLITVFILICFLPLILVSRSISSNPFLAGTNTKTYTEKESLQFTAKILVAEVILNTVMVLLIKSL